MHFPFFPCDRSEKPLGSGQPPFMKHDFEPYGQHRIGRVLLEKQRPARQIPDVGIRAVSVRQEHKPIHQGFVDSRKHCGIEEERFSQPEIIDGRQRSDVDTAVFHRLNQGSDVVVQEKRGPIMVMPLFDDVFSPYFDRGFRVPFVEIGKNGFRKSEIQLERRRGFCSLSRAFGGEYPDKGCDEDEKTSGSFHGFLSCVV